VQAHTRCVAVGTQARCLGLRRHCRLIPTAPQQHLRRRRLAHPLLVLPLYETLELVQNYYQVQSRAW
jgi:hypothetical protein